MDRIAFDYFKNWLYDKNRKPLIVNGARQVGKTWLIRQFGKGIKKANFYELNFEKQKELHLIFQKNYDINRIIFELELFLNTSFNLENDILFFDEIQACPDALMSLRYFYEDKPVLKIIAAGSLLDFQFKNIPYPVGRVENITIHPLNFYEFLKARQKNQLAQLLQEKPITLTASIAALLNEELTLYFIVGGMPESVSNFIAHNNLLKVAEIQDNLLYNYEQDFRKYNPLVNADCLNDILKNSFKLIGHQTIYTKLSDRFSNPTIKKGVDVLETARLLTKVENVKIDGLPLTASGRNFKLFYLDIGLLLRKSQIEFKNIYLKKELTTAFEGALAEQFVAQQLISYNKKLNYWARTESGANAEVDFVMVEQGEIIPMEVKAGKKGAIKSLHYLLGKYQNINLAKVYSYAEFGFNDKITFVPIFYAGLY